MTRRLKQALLLLVVAFAAAQLVRPGGVNPATDASRSIHAQAELPPQLIAVLDRACADCHSHATVWPWYTRIAPASWLMAHGVAKGRQALNFSEWAAYPPEIQQLLLTESCDDARDGKMPGAYTLLHPEMKLSSQDIETVCSAARHAATHAPGNDSVATSLPR